MKRHRDIDFSIETSRFTIQGSSRAGRESWYLLKELGVALDIGRCPEPLFRVPQILLSHAHLDHAAGIPFYGNQRRLLRLGEGTIYVPAENAEQYRKLMRLHEEIEESEYPLTFVGLAEGDEVQLKRDLVARVHRSSHRVPTNAYELLLQRRKPWEGSGASSSGEQERESILYYTGDTDQKTLEQVDAIYGAEVLIIECSFIGPHDEERAERYRHIHASDIFDRADRFENEIIVLSHFSLRNTPAEIHNLISRRAPERLRARLRLALPEPFTRL
jgi:ribonuclease Z